MKMVDSDKLDFVKGGATVIKVDGEVPFTKLRHVVVNGKEYDPMVAMDVSDSIVVVHGIHDFKNEDVSFV